MCASRLGGFSSNPRCLVLILLARSQSVSRANCRCRPKGDTLHFFIAYKISLYRLIADFVAKINIYKLEDVCMCVCVCDCHNLAAIKRGSWNVGSSLGMITRCRRVELSRYAPSMHGGESTRVAPLILKVDDGYRWMVCRTTRPLSALGIVTRYTLRGGGCWLGAKAGVV